jgi:spermidine/putrescine transport system ATP-binding protein
VTEIFYLGTATGDTIRTARGETLVVFRQNAASPEAAVDRGDDVWLCWRPEHTYALPGATDHGSQQHEEEETDG